MGGLLICSVHDVVALLSNNIVFCDSKLKAYCSVFVYWVPHYISSHTHKPAQINLFFPVFFILGFHSFYFILSLLFSRNKVFYKLCLEPGNAFIFVFLSLYLKEGSSSKTICIKKNTFVGCGLLMLLKKFEDKKDFIFQDAVTKQSSQTQFFSQ